MMSAPSPVMTPCSDVDSREPPAVLPNRLFSL
jgi:hypothetical protein